MSHLPIENAALLEELYAKYKKDPQSVDGSVRAFFQGMEYGKPGSFTEVGEDALKMAYRRYGHLAARFNPLREEKSPPSSLSCFSGPDAEKYRKLYASCIGYEFMDLGNPLMEQWLMDRIENAQDMQLSDSEKTLLLEQLSKAEEFEKFLHSKYVGQTRFSLEGAETLIAVLSHILQRAKNNSVEEAVIGMAHRGRLNVLANILQKSASLIFAEFEDDTSLSFEGNDDVKYHMGFVGNWDQLVVTMAANPSHLESVDPVVLGEVKARQVAKNDENKERVLPLLIHGDASLAGQGVIYESLQMMRLPNYSVGGSIHIVVNNQIGYTTLPIEGRSTLYATDIAKAFGCPVFHVNAEDPESCLFAAKLAFEVRQKFHVDVFIDLLCYRKWGHNEGDEPSFTQPLEYQEIRAKKTIRALFEEKHSLQAEELKSHFEKEWTLAKEKAGTQENSSFTVAKQSFDPVATSVEEALLRKALSIFCTIPETFHPHPKLHKWLVGRLSQLDAQIDWATAECLAFATLLMQNKAIRMAGQDAKRGTFSQRHLVWVDEQNGSSYSPLASMGVARIDVVNSFLSEFAGLGFEYGYSKVMQGLPLWEAQYGDFNNGAQIIIDQYIASAEQKWGSVSALTMLLPHGYEGAGPEHSSARMERFLQLAACDNLCIVNATTPAQYFHLLRKQALQSVKKPLIVFTPKSLLRLGACRSKLSDFTSGFFQTVLGDSTEAKRLLLCSGKVYYDLMNAKKRDDVSIVRIEQLYPLDLEKLERYKAIQEVVWVQEEPKNMGAWSYIEPHLRQIFPEIRYVGRKESATTASGSGRKSKQELLELLKEANV